MTIIAPVVLFAGGNLYRKGLGPFICDWLIAFIREPPEPPCSMVLCGVPYGRWDRHYHSQLLLPLPGTSQYRLLPRDISPSRASEPCLARSLLERLHRTQWSTHLASPFSSSCAGYHSPAPRYFIGTLSHRPLSACGRLTGPSAIPSHLKESTRQTGQSSRPKPL